MYLRDKKHSAQVNVTIYFYSLLIFLKDLSICGLEVMWWVQNQLKVEFVVEQ